MIRYVLDSYSKKMPKHMRRRVMSHKVRRVPKRLQEAYQSQLEKCGVPPSTKRPSRKYRRRPSNLLEDYNRRQKKFIWLETHIWHAKRFNMIEKWGYKIPNKRNDKSFRALYRAVTNHCLIQDMSYYICIELKGKEDSILEGLKCLTSTECGLTFAAKYTLSGVREGKVTLFKAYKYPFGAIGSVNFMWKPKLLNAISERTLWIWVHPGMYSEVLQEFVVAFDFKLKDVQESNGKQNESFENKKDSNKDIIKLQKRKFSSFSIPKYSSTTYDVKMNILKDSLNRFRLTGPLAQTVITQSFRPVKIEDVSERDDNCRAQMEDEDKMLKTSDWLYEFFSTIESQKSLKEQNLFFDEMKNVTNPSQLPAHMILPLTVVDPRLQMPNKKQKAENIVNEDSAQSSSRAMPLHLICYSPLWEHEWRERITSSKMTVAEINNLRSKSLVPGIKDDEVRVLGVKNVSYLPVILIQNPGSQSMEKRLGFGSGWDILIPAGWAMPVWLSLIFRGARVGGLRENSSLAREMGNVMFQPDSKMGQEEEAFRKENKLEKHFRLPPNKRPNFIKLGIVTPFHCPWKTLLDDWNPENNKDSDFFVLRDLCKVDILKQALKKNSSLVIRKKLNSVFSKIEISLCLVQVCITVCGRGVIGECSPICLPSKNDLKLLERNKRYRGPAEPIHEDVYESLRKTLREKHLAKLKTLRRNRLKAKQQLQENEEFSFKINKASKLRVTSDLIKKQADKMRELWIPSSIENVKSCSSRPIIGYVTSGDYSFTESCSYGQGYVTLSCMLELSSKSQNLPLVLVRKISSLQYSFAKITVL